MIIVSCWYDEENDRWNAAVRDQESINATGRTEAEMRSILVEAYHRETGESQTEEDFDFVEQPPPLPEAQG